MQQKCSNNRIFQKQYFYLAILLILGVVTDANTGKVIPGATIKVESIDHDITTGPTGDFFRLLVAGKFTILSLTG